MWCILKDIRTPSKFIAAAVGSKFSGVVQGAVSALFDSALGPVLDKFAEVVTVIQAAPTQLVNAGMAQLTALVDQGLAALTGSLSGEVRKLYNDIPQAMADAMAQLRPPSLTVGVTLSPAVRDALVMACQLLDDENKCPLKSDGTRIGFSFVGALTQVKKLETQVSGAVASVKSALIGSNGNGGLIGTLSDGLKVARCLLAKTRKTLGEVDAQLGTINLATDCSFPGDHPAHDIFNGLDAAKVALGLFSCNGGVPAQENVVFSKVNEIASAIDKVLAAAESDTIPGIVQGVGAFLGLDLKNFTQALKEVGGYAKKIRTRLKDARGAVNSAFCGVGGGITQITVPVRGFLGKLAGPLDTAAKATGGLAASVTSVANMLNGVTTQVTAKIDLAAQIATQMKSQFRDKVIILIQYNDELAAAVSSVTIDTTAIDTLPRTKQEFQDLFDDALTLVESQLKLAPGTLYFVSPDPAKGTLVDLVATQLKQPLYDLIGNVQTQVGALFTDLMQQIPFPKKAELRQMLSRLVIESSFVRDLDKLLEQSIRLVLEEVDKLAARLVEQLNQFLREAINKALEVVAKALESVTAPIEKAAGFTGASLDGYAKIVGNAVQLLQIDARFGSKPAKGSGDESKRKDEEQSFRASLLMKSWAMSDKGKNCLPAGGVGADAPGAGYLDATISAYNLPFTMGGKGGLKIQELSIGFTLKGMDPIGINGALITTGKLDFKAFSIRDIRFAMGFGQLENYVGAAAGANFSGYDMSVAFLVGRMCDDSVLRKLDPQFAGFVKVPGEFAGGYVRGSASIPVFNIGCVFQVGFGADFGAWFLNKAVGGLIGGSVFGKIACLVSVRGTVRMGFTYNLETSKPFFKGQGWCAAGLGFCSPAEWMTVEDSRKDGGLCLTMDALIEAEYDDSFELKKLDLTGPH
ncbi:MAG: hypothetical protein IV100_30640 [Myxococcales bacterium]|nr:hypothetical protein [Myxococcales bacterium]